jgi:hypothetical protein
MGKGEIHHAETPHKSAPAASSLAWAADFTFSFLGNPTRRGETGMTKLQCGEFLFPTKCPIFSPNTRGSDLIPTPQVIGIVRINALLLYMFFPCSGETRAWMTRVHGTLKRWFFLCSGKARAWMTWLHCTLKRCLAAIVPGAHV